MKPILSFILFLGLLFTSCQKETDTLVDGIILLDTEKHQSLEKTTVSGTSVQWVTGDKVRFYDNAMPPLDLTVSADGVNAYVDGSSSLNGDIRAYYPIGIIDATGSSDWKTNTPTVVIPNRYDSYYSNGRQVLALPMVGTAGSGAKVVEFKHLTAAFMVVLKNETDSVLTLDSIVVGSSQYLLSDTMKLNLGVAGFGVVARATDKADSVTVRFTDNPTLGTTGFDTVQIPIRPIGTSTLQIQVYAHCRGKAVGNNGVPSVYKTVVYHYNNSKPIAALERNVMMTARVALRTQSGDHTSTDTIDNSLFSVSSAKKIVRFSKGNLKRNGDNWEFNANQYTSTASDLFQWSVVYDWRSNTSVEADTGWSVLSAFEWNYLLTNTSRTATRYLKARIDLGGGNNYANGLIIFPDSYIHPYNLSPLDKNRINTTSVDYSTTFSSAAWSLMESAGAIFLPAAGYYYDGTPYEFAAKGYYWSSTKEATQNKAKRLLFSDSELTTDNAEAQTYGSSIRLVKVVTNN